MHVLKDSSGHKEVLQDIFATHGFPRLLVLDNDPQFIEDTFITYLYIITYQSGYASSSHKWISWEYGKECEAVVKEARERSSILHYVVRF